MKSHIVHLSVEFTQPFGARESISCYVTQSYTIIIDNLRSKNKSNCDISVYKTARNTKSTCHCLPVSLNTQDTLPN